MVESDRVYSLDPATGQLRWQRLEPTAGLGVLPAGGDTLLLVRLAPQLHRRKETPPYGRWAHWLAGKDGRTVRRIPIEGDEAIHTVCAVASDGHRVFGLANIQVNRAEPGKVFRIEFGAPEK